MSKPVPARPRTAEKLPQLPGITDRKLLAAYRDAQCFLRRRYVSGVGIGYAMKNGKYTKELAISIHVDTKVPIEQLTKLQRFPATLGGVRVDVVALRIAPHISGDEAEARQRTKLNPLRPGALLKTEDGDIGTIGLLVTGQRDGKTYLLSAAHVMQSLAVKIYQPNKALAPAFLGQVIAIFNTPGDVAIAECRGRRTLNQPMGSNTPISKVRSVALDDVLTISGAMSGLAKAKVMWIGRKDMIYGPDDVRKVDGFQMCSATATPLSTRRGDSGALWFDEDGAGVGLHVGGDTTDGLPWYFACNLEQAMARLKVKL